MIFPEDQIAELKVIAPDLSISEEGGITYFLITGLKLPDGCNPDTVDALLCPCPSGGYNSTLFLSSQISSPVALNWNRKNVRILGRNWFAISWRMPQGKRLVEILLNHLSAFQKI